ncbi:hypothetical protein GCM10009579_08530 [Streptomyces javensis]|uniref:Uncharacterized protein n=1 Tax=Streptomyces javensis TaxID=114698 RepID=A0ABP4H7I6_9ACTN
MAPPTARKGGAPGGKEARRSCPASVVSARTGGRPAEQARDGAEGQGDDSGDSASDGAQYISDGLEHDGTFLDPGRRD